ncbi:GNAT family N-acetyltransferase [Verrucomicrobium spinosum]|uniref:GNAT family N-acetyltransferase n=1 Tax=Verrucomicrobium spinosum TaxID=2736 RepID=UPI0009467B24|nr:hypothetical protein [Verrucomicrobium spinosum]
MGLFGGWKKSWRAEISFTVADEVQHRGVGSLLLALLWMRACGAGITEFFGVVLPDNYTVLDWFRALGARMTLHGGQYVFELDLNEAKLKPTPTTERFKQRLREVEAALTGAEDQGLNGIDFSGSGPKPVGLRQDLLVFLPEGDAHGATADLTVIVHRARYL